MLPMVEMRGLYKFFTALKIYLKQEKLAVVYVLNSFGNLIRIK